MKIVKMNKLIGLVTLLLLCFAVQSYTEVAGPLGDADNVATKKNNNALISAAREGDAATVSSLLAQGADANAKDEGGVTALMLAASSGHLDIVNALIAAGADVNAQNKDGVTALLAAVAAYGYGHADIAKALIDAGANVNAQSNDTHFNTALSIARLKGNSEIVNMLLNAGAN